MLTDSSCFVVVVVLRLFVFVCLFFPRPTKQSRVTSFAREEGDTTLLTTAAREV